MLFEGGSPILMDLYIRTAQNRTMRHLGGSFIYPLIGKFFGHIRVEARVFQHPFNLGAFFVVPIS